jgi:thermitase
LLLRYNVKATGNYLILGIIAILIFYKGYLLIPKWNSFFAELSFTFLLTGIASILISKKVHLNKFYTLILIPILLIIGSRNLFFEKNSISLFKQGELLVSIQDSNVLLDYTDNKGLRIRKAFSGIKDSTSELLNYYLVDIPDSELKNLEEIKIELEELIGFTYLEENEILEVQTTNDPLIGNQWSLMNPEFEVFQKMILSNKFIPLKKAVVAILDTGVDAFHEDLKNSYTFSHEPDIKGHGTHCAGIAGAETNNNLGIASLGGISNSVYVTGIKVLSDNGIGNQAGIINGIIKAANLNVDVISLSLGGFSNDSKQLAYNQAIKYANERGSIVIAAAGNASRDASKFTPANAQGVIAVSAIDENKNLATFSNTLENIQMGIAAPGQNIISTTPNHSYKTFSGTSMATPYVAGLVAVFKALQPDITTEEIFSILDKTGSETSQTNLSGKLIQPGQSIEYFINYFSHQEEF